MGRPRYIDDAELSSLTTLAVGGRARCVALFDDPADLPEILESAGASRVAVLGSGSNLIVADRGFDGMLLKSADQTRTYDPATGELQAGAGLDWDELVAFTVAEGAAGIECLSGIPGLCGAAPVQNIGAYGQEVGEVLTGLSATDLATGQNHDFSVDECDLGYRHSRFKGEEADRWMITSIRLRLHPGGAPVLRYEELRNRLATEPGASLDRVREVVLNLRRGKSMVYDPSDPNHRSAGSFFTNPVVDRPVLERIGDASMPRWPVDADRVKIPAAWLIERSGFAKGHQKGPAGLSTHHVLALINRGGATAADLLALAREVRDAVFDRFGIRLRPEPVPLGFEPGEIDDLWGSQEVE